MRYNDLEACDSSGRVFSPGGGCGANLGLGGDPEVCLHCDDVLLIESVVGLACEKSRLHVRSSAIEDVGHEAFVAVLLDEVCCKECAKWIPTALTKRRQYGLM